jgi:hypothetical protein
MKKQPTSRTRMTLTQDDYSVLDYLMGCYPQGSELEVGDLMTDLITRGLVERVEAEGPEKSPAVYNITPLGARLFGKYNNVVLLQRA